MCGIAASTIKPITGAMAVQRLRCRTRGRASRHHRWAFLHDRRDRSRPRPPDVEPRIQRNDGAGAVHTVGPPADSRRRASASIDAQMTGAPSAFVLDARVVAESAEVGLARGVGIEAQAQLTMNGLEVSRSSIRPATGGEVLATVDLSLCAPTRHGGSRPTTAASTRHPRSGWRRCGRCHSARAHRHGADHASTERTVSTRGAQHLVAARRRPRRRRSRARSSSSIEGNRWRAKQDHRMGSTARYRPDWRRRGIAKPPPVRRLNGTLNCRSRRGTLAKPPAMRRSST